MPTNTHSWAKQYAPCRECGYLRLGAWARQACARLDRKYGLDRPRRANRSARKNPV